MQALQDWLLGRGWPEVGALFAVLGVGLLSAFVAAELFRIVGRLALRRMKRPTAEWIEALEKKRVLRGFGWIIAALVADAQVTPLFEAWSKAEAWVGTVFSSVLVVAVVVAVNRLIGATVEFLENRQGASRRIPYKVLGQAVQLMLWTYGAIVFGSVVTHQDVTSLLTGLTALGAVLTFVFKDPLLGWTAGIQIAANDLANTGDWIEVPQHGADGTVVEITLTTIKVSNWDNTISTVPSYSLISEGFRNYRGMYESGGRRIKRAIAVDSDSLRPCDAELLERVRKTPLGEKALEGVSVSEGALSPGAHLTNLGCYRRWLEAWLAAHPLLNPEMTMMVRELAPTGRGIPVEFYAFTAGTAWVDYEHTQADILDDAVAVLPEFGLRLFQEPTAAVLAELRG